RVAGALPINVRNIAKILCPSCGSAGGEWLTAAASPSIPLWRLCHMPPEFVPRAPGIRSSRRFNSRKQVEVEVDFDLGGSHRPARLVQPHAVVERALVAE